MFWDSDDYDDYLAWKRRDSSVEAIIFVITLIIGLVALVVAPARSGYILGRDGRISRRGMLYHICFIIMLIVSFGLFIYAAQAHELSSKEISSLMELSLAMAGFSLLTFTISGLVGLLIGIRHNNLQKLEQEYKRKYERARSLWHSGYQRESISVLEEIAKKYRPANEALRRIRNGI